MRRAFFSTLVLALVILLFVGCVPNVDTYSNSPYRKIPFSSGQKIPSAIVSKGVTGTFRVYPYGSEETYLVSLYPDGTADAIGESYATSVRIGSWSSPSGTNSISVNIPGVLAAANTIDWSLWNSDHVFRVEATRDTGNIYFNLFFKLTDETMNASIYSDPSFLNGLYGYTDDYGIVKGVRFLDDELWWYSQNNTVGEHLDWKLSQSKAEVRIVDGKGETEYLSIAKTPSFLIMGGQVYRLLD